MTTIAEVLQDLQPIMGAIHKVIVRNVSNVDISILSDTAKMRVEAAKSKSIIFKNTTNGGYSLLVLVDSIRLIQREDHILIVVIA